MKSAHYDIVCVGAGIVGLATALAVARRFRCSLLVLEAEKHPGTHQTRHNSGVLHSGVYYRPGSLKARNCVEGRQALCRFCDRHEVPYEITGKLVVAGADAELPLLDELEARGRANGLDGLRRLAAGAISEREPHVRGLAALLVPQTGIVDFEAVAAALAGVLRQRGVEIRTQSRVVGIRMEPGCLSLQTSGGSIRCSYLINCAGLQSDRVARLAGVEPEVRIIPFRGDYLRLAPQRRYLVRHHVYPIPDPELPFLGVHLSRRIDGEVEAGPSAVLAWEREGYSRWSFSLRDTAETLLWPGFWRLAARRWRQGVKEIRRGRSRRRFAAELRPFVPELRAGDLLPGGCGVRAQAVDRGGRLVDDFYVVEAENMLHIVNAPSPAATACLAIGDHLAARVGERFSLRPRT